MSKFANVKLGKQAPKIDHRTLRMCSYITKLPPVPAKLSWLHSIENVPGFDWHMYKNDQVCDCAIASPAHIDMIWSRNSDKPDIDPTDEAVLISYSKISGYNPVDSTNDNGCVLLQVMNEWRTNGLFGHPGIMGYVSINPHNIQLIKTAIYLFGAVNVGLSLPASAQNQPDLWSVTNKQLREDAAPGSWGGHAICIGEYDDIAKEFVCITWGKRQRMSYDFFTTYCDEAYAALSDDWLNTTGLAPCGLDLANLKADLGAVS